MNEGEWFWQLKLEKVAAALSANGLDAVVVGSGDEARRRALELIPDRSTVGLGGSRTVRDIGLLDALRKGDFKLYDQYDPGLSKADSLDRRMKGARAQYFVSGSNAVTEDGKLINVDGLGNRLAAFCFGPEKVVVVAGRNKVVETVEDGLRRVRRIAAPMNARRFGVNTPCAQAGECSDCRSPERICNLTLIIERQKDKRISVILVNQDLGF
jgi:hypothetical protein